MVPEFSRFAQKSLDTLLEYMYYDFMSSCMVHYFSVRTRLCIAILCAVSVFAIASCASGPAGPPNVHYQLARVYMGQQAMIPGQSGDFWTGLTGTVVATYPWEGGPEDATGVFFLAANNTHFFIRAEIQDAAPQLRHPDLAPDLAWNGTSIQVFFGPNVARRGELIASDSDLSLWVVPGADGEPVVRVSRGGLLNERQFSAAVVEWTESSYIIEASFPLAVMGINRPLVVDQGFRAEFRINHAPMYQPRSVIVNWRTYTDDAWNNPLVWSYGQVVARP